MQRDPRNVISRHHHQLPFFSRSIATNARQPILLLLPVCLRRLFFHRCGVAAASFPLFLRSYAFKGARIFVPCPSPYKKKHCPLWIFLLRISIILCLLFCGLLSLVCLRVRE